MRRRTPQEIANFFESTLSVNIIRSVWFEITNGYECQVEIPESLIEYKNVVDGEYFTPQTICTDCSGNGFVIGRNGRMGGHFCTTCHSTGWVDKEKIND